MSEPRIGDTVIAMAFQADDGPLGGRVGPAVVVAVHDNNVLDVLIGVIGPNNANSIGWAGRLGLIEVATVGELRATQFDANGDIAVAGTWCRREVCG